MPPLFQELVRDIEGEIDSGETLTKYATDNSPFFVFPQVVIYPKTTKDIKLVVSFAKLYHIPITVRGCGNGTKGGVLSEGIILDMYRYFDKLGKFTVSQSTLTVQAGALLTECLKRITPWGYTFPFVDHEEEMTVGGMVATHYKSSTSFTYGDIGDWVESLRIVLDDGEEYIVSVDTPPYGRLLEIYAGIFSCLKVESDTIFSAHLGVPIHSAGYGVFTTHVSPKMLLDFICGSEGTLGIITEVTLRLGPPPQYHEGVAISLSMLDDLEFLAEKIASMSPLVCNGFDVKTLELSRAPTHIIKRHTQDVFIVYVLFEGTEGLVARTLATLIRQISSRVTKEHTYLLSKEECALYQDIFFTQKKSLEAYAGGMLTAVSICNDVVFPYTSFVLPLKELQSLCDEYGVFYSTTVELCTGVVHIETLFDIHKKDIGETLVVMLSQVAHIVKWYRGALTYSHGDGILTTPLLPVFYSSGLIETFKKIKRVWDPSDIFNPGKKTTLDLTYLSEHIKHTPQSDVF